MMEKLFGRTRKEWENDMIRLNQVADILYSIQAKAAQDGKANVQQEAMEALKSILRVNRIMEILLKTVKRTV